MFKYGIFKFDLSLELPVESRFIEATLRGGLGYSFKRTVCINRNAQCPECDFKHTCVYQYVFESMTPPDAKRMRKCSHVPHPFAIYLKKNEDREIIFELKLFGAGVKYLPYFIHSFLRLGRVGLGRERSRYEILSVQDCSTGLHIYEDGDITSNTPTVVDFKTGDKCREKIGRVKINLKSPLAIRKNGKLLLTADPEKFIITLLRRIDNILYFHCGVRLNIDFKEMKKMAGKLSLVESNIRQVARERYSTRQKRRISLMGVTGDFVIEGDITPFYDYLRLGEIVQVGRGTSFGQGQYEMEVLDLGGV